MARQRFIWPTLWTDPDIGILEPLERLLFIALFSLADDEGRIDANPAFLKASVFPYDTITIAEVKELRDALVEKHDNVSLYTVDGDDYIALAKWAQHQKPKYPTPSRLPTPPTEKPCKPRGKSSRKPPPSGDLPEASGSVPLRDGLGRVGKGRTSLKETKDVRAPDLLWDALDPVYGKVTNDGERGRRNKALKLIRQSLNGVPEQEAAAEVGRRAVVCHALYPLGREMALANHWAELEEAPVVGRKRTGWRWVRGSGGGTYVRDPEGTDPLPAGYVLGGVG